MQKEHYTKITADEINCLIYSYFVDSGFKHSAFTLNAEARLEHSPFFRKRIRRGELVELLIKALLYIEVESHWKRTDLNLGCKAGFSLLEPHICSLEPPLPEPVTTTTQLAQNPNGDVGNKRKSSSPLHENGRSEKRAKVDTQATQPKRISRDSPAPDSHPTPTGPVYQLKGHTSEVFVCSWSPRNNRLATGSKNAMINIYDLPRSLAEESVVQLKMIEGLTTMEQGDITSLEWNHDGTLLAIGSYDAYIRVYRPNGDPWIIEKQHKGPVFSLRFSPDGKYVASASLDGSSSVWNIAEKKCIGEHKDHTDCCLVLNWLDDNRFLTGGADGKVFLYSVDKEQAVYKFEGHTDEVNQVLANTTKTKIGACSDDRTLRIWDLSMVEEEAVPGLGNNSVVVLSGHTHAVCAFEWCPVKDPKGPEYVASCSFDGRARLWDAISGACMHIFDFTAMALFTITWSPDGRFIASAGAEGKMAIFSAKTGSRLFMWQSDKDKPGIFDLKWMQADGEDRLAMALEKRVVGLLDAREVPELR